MQKIFGEALLQLLTQVLAQDEQAGAGESDGNEQKRQEQQGCACAWLAGRESLRRCRANLDRDRWQGCSPVSS